MSYSLIGFTQPTQNNGYAPVAPVSGEDFFQVNGDDLTLGSDGRIIGGAYIAASSAGVRWGWKVKTWPQFFNTHDAITVDDGPRRQASWVKFNRVVKDRDLLNVQADNANTLEITNILLAQALKDSVELGPMDPGMLPDGAFTIRGVGSTTMVAITMNNVPMTWDYDFDPNMNYKIIGMSFEGVSALYARLRGKQGSSLDLLNNRPGWIASTIGTEEGLPCMIKGADIVFPGTHPPDLDWVSTTTDSAQAAALTLLEV